jgi:DNA-binding HxlR family transcriptional regulator
LSRILRRDIDIADGFSGVVPPKVEYRLTRKGKSFVPIIAAIRNWGTRHLTQADSAQRPLGLAAE